MNRTKELAYWINERESMRLRKEVNEDAPQLPFSEDPAMANVRYCNVHREDDKVTRWIAKNWRNPSASDPLLTLYMVAARMINLPETLKEIGLPSDVDKAEDLHPWFIRGKAIIQQRYRRGDKAWTSAYTISTCGRRMGKEDYVFDHVLSQVARRPWDCDGKSLATVYSYLRAVDGLGSFLAAQVIADLKNTPLHPLSRAPDFWVWAAPGPGSLRGLEAYYGTRVTQSGFAQAIAECYRETIPLVFPYVGDLHMQDFQNCLCEFSKYMRVKEGDGRVRNSYHAVAR